MKLRAKKAGKKDAAARGGHRRGAAPKPRGANANGRPSAAPSLVVGIGASAGGLNAFKTFFANMPPDTGMSFVLVQHLDPHHKSLLGSLLANHTDMPVAEAADGMFVAPDHVFVIPPDATLCIRDGFLEVVTPAPPRERRRPIDSFFTSLAEDQGEKAVCIVLSGSGSDGSIGLRTIKEHGGLILAQTGLDATGMSGMPDSAAATGLVDFVIPVEAMPRKLIEHQRHLDHVSDRKDSGGGRRDMAEHLKAITALVHARIGHDFGQYKDNTLIRRVQRRMQVLQIGKVSEYVARLRKDPEQVEALYRDLLIGVTEFFRNEDAFEVLRATVIPKLVETLAHEPGRVIRVWIPGCATGEEAYSIAILLQEAMLERDARGGAANVQIFGTDIDDKAVAVARTGRYRKALAGLSPERIQRWFVNEGPDWCPVKQIRDMCIFSQHSLVKDPPFSKLDLISCRNVLIYLNSEMQSNLLRTFHYALRPGGFLFLGPSEGVARNIALFDECDKKHRIFRRRDTGESLPPRAPNLPATRELHSYRKPPEPAAVSARARIGKAGRHIMEKYAPAYVIVDKVDDILSFSGGEVGAFLEPSSGEASLNLFRVLKKALRPAVQAALHAVRTGEKAAVRESAALKIDGKGRTVTLIVEPIPERIGAGHCFVGFRAAEPAGARGAGAAPAETADATVQALEQELRATRTQLQNVVEDQETANEEMKSANEEYQSINEELQAANEELETSKEEMQSINEELQTLNVELGAKNETLTSLNSDLKNLLASSHIATIFLDKGLRIRSFTPAVEALFNLRKSDVGRPLTDLVSKLRYGHLQRDVEKVLRTLSLVETEVRLADGSEAFIMRIRPYISVKDVVDGVVITFVDITERHKGEVRRALLTNELNHRVKNTLASVVSIAIQTLRTTETSDDFRQAFLMRILALSKAHDLLTTAEWDQVPLRKLALLELTPYCEVNSPRCVIEGPDLVLSPRVILALGMAFHELVTNAAKHGALSVPEGRIAVAWEIRDGDGGRRRLHLTWTESGGPAVRPRTRKGFGSRLIEDGLSQELDGAAELHFDPGGLRCVIDMPLEPAVEPA